MSVPVEDFEFVIYYIFNVFSTPPLPLFQAKTYIVISHSKAIPDLQLHLQPFLEQL